MEAWQEFNIQYLFNIELLFNIIQYQYQYGLTLILNIDITTAKSLNTTLMMPYILVASGAS